MKTFGLVLSIVSATILPAMQSAGQSTSQPAEKAGLPRPAAAPATSPAGLMWRGLDLSAAPVSSDVSRLPDIWEAVPPGSRSYEVRSDVTVIRTRENNGPRSFMTAATVYWLRSANRFYVQHDPAGSSTRHFYGPFQGDPNQVLTPPASQPAGR